MRDLSLMLLLPLLLLVNAAQWTALAVTILPSQTRVEPDKQTLVCPMVSSLLSVACSTTFCAEDTYMASATVYGALYQFTSSYPGTYRFSTDNEEGSCDDTYLSVHIVGAAAPVCNDDISVTNSASAIDLYLAQNAVANILVAEKPGKCGLFTRTVAVDVTLMTTLAPSPLPTKSPTSSLPTRSPTKSPTTSRPSTSPTRSPTTSRPTQAPTKSPTTSRPTLSPTTSRPTLSPTTSLPTTSPTRSPTYFCRPGSYSANGYNTPQESCQLCPAGHYDLPVDAMRTDCTSGDTHFPCEEEFWCGAGAVLGQSYVRVLSHEDVSTTLVVASKGTFTANFFNLVDRPLVLRAVPPQGSRGDGYALPKGIYVAGDLIHVPAAAPSTMPGGGDLEAAPFVFSFQANADELENLGGEADNEFTGVILVEGRYADDDQVFTFRSTLQVKLQLVSVVINPSQFDYALTIGHVYSSESQSMLSHLPVSEILNPLCTGTLSYRAAVCTSTATAADDNSVLIIGNGTLVEASLPPGQSFGNAFAFAIDLTSLAPQLDFTQDARVLHACFKFDMVLQPLNISFNRRVDVAVKVLESCPPGSSSLSGTNEVGCQPCAESMYQPEAGKSLCFPVSPGERVNANRTGVEKCEPGTYSSQQTQACVLCPRGTYAASTGSAFCQACPSTTFPTTLNEGSTSVDDCTTDELQEAFKTALGELELCPVGTTCDFDGATVETFKVDPGYYRTSNQSLDVRACRPKFCEPPVADDEGRRRRLSSYSPQDDTQYCSPHHQGHLCELCAPGYLHRGEYRTCTKCDGQATGEDFAKVSGALFGLVLAVIAVSTAVIAYTYLFWKPKPFTAEEAISGDVPTITATYAPRRFPLLAKLSKLVDKLDVGSTPFKITVGYYQVVAGMAFALSDYLPEYFQQLAHLFSLLSLDFIKVFDFGCSLPDKGHFSSLLFSTLAPAGYLLAALLAERVATKCVEHPEALHVGFMNVYLWILFLIYPSTAKTIFQTFSCAEFDDGMSFVTADLTMDCASERYRGIFVYGVFAVIVFVLGIPALFYRLLDRQRFLLDACPEFEPRISLAYREKNLRVQGTRMLWSGYSPRRYNFEVFELVRKLFQTSLFVFVSPDSAGQVISLLVVCAFVIVLLGWADPYVKQVHNGLAQWAQWNIFAIAFVALLNRMALTSPSEKAALHVLLIMCLVSVPLLALVIVLRAAKSSEYASKALDLVQQKLDTVTNNNNNNGASPASSGAMVAASTRRMFVRQMTKLASSSSSRRGGGEEEEEEDDGTNKAAVAMSGGGGENSALVELQRIITATLPGQDALRDRMLSLLDVLSKSIKQEYEVSRLEHNMLKNRESETNQLLGKIAELTEEQDALVFDSAMAENQLKLLQRRFADELAHVRDRQHGEDGHDAEEQNVFQREHQGGGGGVSPTKQRKTGGGARPMSTRLGSLFGGGGAPHRLTTKSSQGAGGAAVEPSSSPSPRGEQPPQRKFSF